MSQSDWIALLVAVALVAANLPFLTQRLFGLVRLPGAGVKSLAWRLLELVVCFAGVLWLGQAMERSLGQNHAQGWAFYAVTGALFLTAAFPGFVYRYLLRRGG